MKVGRLDRLELLRTTFPVEEASSRSPSRRPSCCGSLLLSRPIMDEMHVFFSVVQLILNDIYFYFLLRIFVPQLRNVVLYTPQQQRSFWWVA